MINTDRIVQVSATDLLTLYSVILDATGVTLTKADADDTEGDFTISSASTALIASEPAKSITIDSSVTSATIYFVPTYDYTGFTLGTTATATTGDDVTADGRTLYKAELASGAVTITQIGL